MAMTNTPAYHGKELIPFVGIIFLTHFQFSVYIVNDVDAMKSSS